MKKYKTVFRENVFRFLAKMMTISDNAPRDFTVFVRGKYTLDSEPRDLFAIWDNFPILNDEIANFSAKITNKTNPDMGFYLTSFQISSPHAVTGVIAELTLEDGETPDYFPPRSVMPTFEFNFNFLVKFGQVAPIPIEVDLGLPSPIPTVAEGDYAFAFNTQIENPPGYTYDRIFYRRQVVDNNWQTYTLGTNILMNAKGKLYTVGYFGDVHSTIGEYLYDLVDWSFADTLVYLPVAPFDMTEELSISTYDLVEINLDEDVLIYHFEFTPTGFSDDLSYTFTSN